MNATANVQKYQRHRVAQLKGNSNSTNFFNLLTSDALLNKVEELLPEHRERSFPPTETLSMFLAQAMSSDRSCQSIVNKSAVQRLVDGLVPCSTYTGGYCRARQRLPLEMIKGLAHELGHKLDDQASIQWRWKERKIRIVDGTKAGVSVKFKIQSVAFSLAARHKSMGINSIDFSISSAGFLFLQKSILEAYYGVSENTASGKIYAYTFNLFWYCC